MLGFPNLHIFIMQIFLSVMRWMMRYAESWMQHMFIKSPYPVAILLRHEKDTLHTIRCCEGNVCLSAKILEYEMSIYRCSVSLYIPQVSGVL